MAGQGFQHAAVHFRIFENMLLIVAVSFLPYAVLAALGSWSQWERGCRAAETSGNAIDRSCVRVALAPGAAPPVSVSD